MANNILFVFEGEKTELQIATNLQKYFLSTNTVITCAYCTTIYRMYREVAADEDLDVFSLLQAMPKNASSLKKFTRSDFAEIYMFFDYDGHSTGADDAQLLELLKFFNEETDKGKLYISYPMIESLKHISDFVNFKDSKVACKVNVYYKHMVSVSCLKGLINFTTYTNAIWKKVIVAHLMKMNFIVNGNYTLPIALCEQTLIFDSQKKKYIDIDSTVAVLNAFPVFLHDYYGNQKLLALVI